MSSNKVVLDASAMLVVINREPGREKLTPELLVSAACSAVNIAEVQSKLVTRGWSADRAWEDALSPAGEVVDFTASHARVAGDLIASTSHLGLSLGDRACLALAISLKAPVYTTDKAWKNLKLGIPIHILR